MRLVIPMPPAPKGRPKFGNGHAYTPEKTKAYEEAVRLIARARIKEPLTNAIRLTVTFYLPIPKSWSEAKKRLARAGQIRPTTKPDIDNLEKALMDALNGGIGYSDDKLIVEKHSYEYYSDTPKTVLELEEI